MSRVECAVRVRAMALPEVHEEQAWGGRRWRIRQRTFAQVATVVNDRGENTLLTFRSSGEELDVLHSIGHPFFRPGWGTNVVGMVLSDRTDWEEVGELLTDSYCVMAPKKLAAQARLD
jgi:predicted DNA-binding protein (MmcQ/YjbR family)